MSTEQTIEQIIEQLRTLRRESQDIIGHIETQTATVQYHAYLRAHGKAEAKSTKEERMEARRVARLELMCYRSRQSIADHLNAVMRELDDIRREASGLELEG